jgi:hypothetical protein
MTTYPFNVK